MGRPSKLTDAQWDKLGRRLLSGESTSSLAREYGVSKSNISERFSERNLNIKEAANHIVTADVALAKLNVSERQAAYSHADFMKETLWHLNGAASLAAATMHRMSVLANGRAERIPDGELDEAGRTAMTEVMAFTKIANEASQLPINLLKINKEAVEEQRQREKEAAASKTEFKAKSSAEAAVVYQQMIGSGS